MSTPPPPPPPYGGSNYPSSGPVGGYQPPPGYGAYGQPGSGGAFQQQKNSGMAIAALVLSLSGILCGVTAILGVIFGFVSRSQISKSGGTKKGAGMALAGIIIGLVVIIGYIGVLFWVRHNCLNIDGKLRCGADRNL